MVFWFTTINKCGIHEEDTGFFWYEACFCWCILGLWEY